jgi:hypothetical protein
MHTHAQALGSFVRVHACTSVVARALCLLRLPRAMRTGGCSTSSQVVPVVSGESRRCEQPASRARSVSSSVASLSTSFRRQLSPDALTLSMAWPLVASHVGGTGLRGLLPDGWPPNPGARRLRGLSRTASCPPDDWNEAIWARCGWRESERGRRVDGDGGEEWTSPAVQIKVRLRPQPTRTHDPVVA